MSGGSFDYLFLKRFDELLENSRTVDALSNALSELHPSSKAARDTEQVRTLLIHASALLHQADNLLNAGLADVWQQVEYFYSNDVGKFQVGESVINYEIGSKHG